MKKIISLLLTIFAVSAFIGCADDSKSDATQGGQSSSNQSIDGITIDPAPKDNVITLKPTPDGKYVLTFTNGTLSSVPKDIFFQFDMDFNGIDMNDVELIQEETTCPVERTLFYNRLDKHPDRRTCKITYKINKNKKDIYMKKFIVIKDPKNDHTYNPNNTQGATITIKHQ